MMSEIWPTSSLKAAASKSPGPSARGRSDRASPPRPPAPGSSEILDREAREVFLVPRAPEDFLCDRQGLLARTNDGRRCALGAHPLDERHDVRRSSMAAPAVLFATEPWACPPSPAGRGRRRRCRRRRRSAERLAVLPGVGLHRRRTRCGRVARCAARQLAERRWPRPRCACSAQKDDCGALAARAAHAQSTARRAPAAENCENRERLPDGTRQLTSSSRPRRARPRRRGVEFGGIFAPAPRAP